MSATTHLCGTAEPAVLAQDRPTVNHFGLSSITLGRVDLLQVTYEIAATTMQELLPPSLHPSIPGHVAWQVWASTDSPIGPFKMGVTRIGCRFGSKPRCLVARAVVDSPPLARLLEAEWGYPVTMGEVTLRRAYDRVASTVAVENREILSIELRNPMSFTGGTIRYTANLNLAHTPRGLRLIQADADYVFDRIDRGEAVLHAFDADAWHAPALHPTSPIVATLAVAEVTLHEVRFICDPALLATEGTEDLRKIVADAQT